MFSKMLPKIPSFLLLFIGFPALVMAQSKPASLLANLGHVKLVVQIKAIPDPTKLTFASTNKIGKLVNGKLTVDLPAHRLIDKNGLPLRRNYE